MSIEILFKKLVSSPVIVVIMGLLLRERIMNIVHTEKGLLKNKQFCFSYFTL